MNKTTLALDTIQIIEENRQVTYWRKPRGVTDEQGADVWVQTSADGVSPLQIGEIVGELCHLERRNEQTRKEIREGGLVYSCDVNIMVWLAVFSFVVFEVLAWVLVAGHGHGHVAAHGYSFAFIVGLNLAARFIAVPMFEAFATWRSSRKTG
jgi:hypothetical protein